MTLLVSREMAAVCHLSINRPEKRNALNMDMYRELNNQLQAAIRDETVQVIVLSAQGADFCAGNDLADFLDNPELGSDHPIISLLHALADCPKPLLAAVQGHAVGIGATLLLHMDLVYLGDNTRLSFPFIDLGLVPEFASSLLLPQRLGHVRACQLLLLGDALDATTACDWGLANQVLPAAELQPRIEEAARRLAAKPAQALLHSKALLKAPQQELLHQTITREIDYFQQALASFDARQRIGSLLARVRQDSDG